MKKYGWGVLFLYIVVLFLFSSDWSRVEAEPVGPSVTTNPRPVVDGNVAVFSGTSGFVIKDGGTSISSLTNLWQQSGDDIYYSEGKVGIGTNAPVEKLDVDGITLIGGYATVAGITDYLSLGAQYGTNTVGHSGNQKIKIWDSSSGSANTYGIGLSSGLLEIQAANAGGIGLFVNSVAGVGTEAMRILPSGNVGIGTATPDAPLEVDAGATALAMHMTGSVSPYFLWEHTGSGPAQGYVQATADQVIIGSLSSDPLTFATAATGRMYIDTSGNVGIGTATPEYLLHAQGDSVPFVAERANTVTNISQAAVVLRSTSSADMVDEYGPRLTYQIKDVTGVANTIGAIDVVRSGNDTSGAMKFYTKNTGNMTDPEMTILPSGNVGIGTDSPNQTLDVNVGKLGANVVDVETYFSAGASEWGLNLDINGTDVATFRVNAASGEVQIGSKAANYFPTFYSNGSEFMRANTQGDVSVGHTDPDTQLDVNGAVTTRELSADPADPDEGANVTWQSDGTGAGDDGDIMIKITAGGVTKTITLVDFSAF